MNRTLAIALLSCVGLLGACAHSPSAHNPMATWVPSENFDERRPVIIVLHATEQGSVQESLDTLRSANRGGKVSSHYLIGDDGHIYQLVDEGKRAWHAGGGSWGTLTDLNSTSIGIEIDNQRGEPYTSAQMASIIRLLEDLCTRLNIPRTQVIGHSDLAPTRKVDPGARFPWKVLADAGFGRWPRGERVDPPAGFDPWLAMAAIGYPLTDRGAAVRAFHQHYRAQEDGDDPQPLFDAEDLRILHALTSSAVALTP
ncbi:MAG: N-acetylmuramoyl-L-alanine amidase [Thermomonas sp.]